MICRELTAAEYRSDLIGDATPVGEFRPFASYNPKTDRIEFFTSNEAFKAKRIDDRLTVYIGRDSNRVVGGLAKGLAEIP